MILPIAIGWILFLSGDFLFFFYNPLPVVAKSVGLDWTPSTFNLVFCWVGGQKRFLAWNHERAYRVSTIKRWVCIYKLWCIRETFKTLVSLKKKEFFSCAIKWSTSDILSWGSYRSSCVVNYRLLTNELDIFSFLLWDSQLGENVIFSLFLAPFPYPNFFVFQT